MWGADEVEGKLDEMRGRARHAVGNLTDNDDDREAGQDQTFHGQAEQAHAEGTDDLGNATRISGDARIGEDDQGAE